MSYLAKLNWHTLAGLYASPSPKAVGFEVLEGEDDCISSAMSEDFRTARFHKLRFNVPNISGARSETTSFSWPTLTRYGSAYTSSKMAHRDMTRAMLIDSIITARQRH